MRPLAHLARLLAALAFTAGAAPASAAVTLTERMAGVPLGAEVELLEDPGKALTLAEVRDGAWKDRFKPSRDASVNLGYRDAALWVRLTLERFAAPGPWLLEVGYPLLDRVELYGPGVDAPWLGGDGVPMSGRPFSDRHFIFPVDAPEAGANVYLLRIAHTGTMSVPLRLWDRDSFPRGKRDESFILGAYYGLLGVMVIYNLFLFLIIRDRAYLAYGIYVSAMGFVIAVNNGFGGLYLWPESPRIADWAQVSAAPLVSATAALFTRIYLDTPSHARGVNRVLTFVIVAGFALLPVTLAVPRAVIFWVDHLLALLTLAAMVAAGWQALRRGYRPARFFAIAFTAVIIGACFMVARNFGLPANLVTDYGIQIGSALEVVLLSMGLADRINGLRREKEAAQGVALTSQEMLVDALRETERKLESRVSERTMELEALNRSLQAEVSEREHTSELLKASEERMRYQAQHDPLTGLPNRWLLRDRLVQATARAKRDRLAFAVLMVDLDNFKAVNDTLGHDVGDLLLVEVAQRLAGCIRERDTIARLGGDEFVFMLEGLSAPEDSALVARKIVEVLAQPFAIAGELLRTSPSIGISLYPEDGQDPDFLLKFADIAMYRAKAAGRNCYRFYRDPEQLHAYEDKKA